MIKAKHLITVMCIAIAIAGLATGACVVMYKLFKASKEEVNYIECECEPDAV